MTSMISLRSRYPAASITMVLVAGTLLAAAQGAATAAEPTAVRPVSCPSSACVQVARDLGWAVALVPDDAGNVYATYQHGELKKIDTATGRAVTVATGLGNLRGIALDGRGNAYVGDFDGRLHKVDLDTGADRIVATRLGPVQAVAWTAEGVYAVSGDSKLYQVRENDQPPRLVATGTGFSQSIALDGRGNAYLGNMMAGQILRVDLATGQVRTLLSRVYEPTSVSLGRDGGVYFLEVDTVSRLDPGTGSSVEVTLVRGLNTVGFRLDRNEVAWAADSRDGGALWRITGLTR